MGRMTASAAQVKEEFDLCKLRLPRPLLRDVAEIALAYGESRNEFLKRCVERQVREELENDELQEAVLKMRSLREARV